ncbi:MAG TPA: TonB-dependent receptor [Fibrobacteraceae bacterium]|nr:TonB-dependent receptor [Fibrobacteraceae bacterium]
MKKQTAFFISSILLVSLHAQEGTVAPDSVSPESAPAPLAVVASDSAAVPKPVVETVPPPTEPVAETPKPLPPVAASAPSAEPVAPVVAPVVVPSQALEELVVSAKKQEKKEEKVAPKAPTRSVAKANAVPVYDRFRTPESSPGVEVYSQEDIKDMQPTDIYSVFERALGMTISRQGSRIHNWVSGRGGDKSALGIILDGVYMPATAAQRVLGDLPVELIESVRIVRDASIMTMGPVFSPGSSKSGSGNQGFIIITTKRCPRDSASTTQATVGYGSYDAVKLNAFQGNTFDSVGYFSLGYAKNRNDSRVDRNGDWHNSYDGNSFLSNAGLFSIGPVSADLMVYYNQARRDIQRYQLEDGTLSSAYWTYDPMNTRVASINLTGQWTPNQITNLSAGYIDAIGTQYGDKIDTAGNITLAEGRDSKDRAVEGNLLHTWTLDHGSLSNALKFGSQVVGWYQLTEGKTQAYKENLYGFYISDEIGLWDQLSFDAGFRIDKRYIVKGGETYIADSTTARLADHMWGGDATSFSVGGAYDFTKDYNVTARFGYNNTPTSRLLSTVDNKELDPEKRLKYELGGNAIILPALGITTTGYYYDIKNAKVQAVDSDGEDMILISSDGDEITVYDAAGHIARYGLELSVFGNGLGPFGYRVGYSLFKCDSAALDRQLPRYKLTAEVTYTYKKFHASLNALKVPKYYKSTDIAVGDYLVFNAAVSQQLTDHMQLSLSAKNFTNEHYTVNNKSASSGFFYDVGAWYAAELSLKF